MHQVGRPSSATTTINYIRTEGCTTSTTLHLSQYGTPELIDWYEYTDRIEMIYTETKLITTWPESPDQRRVFKIVYSCVDGKWNKSNPIYGEIIPPTDEEYHFND